MGTGLAKLRAERHAGTEIGMSAPMRIGVLGHGAIGRALVEGIRTDPDLELVWLYLRDATRAPGWVSADRIVTEAAQLFDRPVDLVVEAVVPEVARGLLLPLAAVADLLPFTLTELADEAFHAEIDATLRQSGHRLHVPNGALIGLDGIAAAAAGGLLETVSIHTRKSPESLGLPAGTSGIVLDGTAREACPRFKRNVNSHAALALAGLGFDKTRSIVEAVPGYPSLSHRIEARGAGFAWSVDVASTPVGKVTGAFTPASALASLRRRVIATPGIRMA